MSRLHPAPLLAAVLVVVTGCADKTPARIETASFPDVITSAAGFQLDAHLVNAAGERLAAVPVTASAVPTDVLSISGTEARCLKAGDATMTLAGGGLSSVKTVKCRLPAKVSALKSAQVIIGLDPTDLEIEIVDVDGKPMSDFPITLDFDRAVVDVTGGKVSGRKVGKTNVIVKAGALQASTAVEVVEKTTSDVLLLGDGAIKSYTLQAGRYLVEVQGKAGSNGVSLRWVGADCPNQPEKQVHKVTCLIANTATVTIENPSVFGMGDSAEGFVNIYAMPK